MPAGNARASEYPARGRCSLSTIAYLTLPRLKAGEFFLHPEGLLVTRCQIPSSGPLSRSVSRAVQLVGFRVPLGTIECFRKDVQSSIMLTVQDHTAARTDVCTYAQGLLDTRSTLRTILAGIMGLDCNHRDSVQERIILDPLQEYSPTCIMNALCQFAVANHVSDLKMFIGNQVARRDKRVCLLSGKIFTLPLNFQMPLRQGFSGFLSIRRLLLFLGESFLKTFQPFFSFAIVPGIGYGIAFRVSQERFEPHINANLASCSSVLNLAFCFDHELTIVAIGTPDKTYPFDLGQRKICNLTGTDQTEPAYPTAIREGDMTTIRFKPPSSGLVLNRSVIMLKLWIAFLSRFLVLAIVIEPTDSGPRPICAGLSCLGIEASGKSIRTGQDGTVALEIVFVHVAPVHPLAQAFIANELDNAYALVNGSVLCFVPIQLVLVGEQTLFLRRLLLDIFLNSFRADISCCAVEGRSCPQRRHSLQMWEFLPQMMRGPSFDQSSHVSRKRLRITSDEQMNMIWLNCQVQNLPSILIYYFFSDLFQAVTNWTYQDFPAALGTPNNVVDDQMDCVLFMDILMYHGCIVRQSHVLYQQVDPALSASKGRLVHPLDQSQGLSWPGAVKFVTNVRPICGKRERSMLYGRPRARGSFWRQR